MGEEFIASQEAIYCLRQLEKVRSNPKTISKNPRTKGQVPQLKQHRLSGPESSQKEETETKVVQVRRRIQQSRVRLLQGELR